MIDSESVLAISDTSLLFQNYVVADSLGYIDHNEFPLYHAICCA